MQRQVIDLLVHGASELATPLGQGARSGTDMDEVQVLDQGAVAVHQGCILACGSEADLRAAYEPTECFDAEGGTLLPGFVDAHTHPVFAGTREAEFAQRLAGARYTEIAAAGGGILSTVKGVRSASREELLALLLTRLDRFLMLGTTTIEAKSGYGLTPEDEIKSLEVLRDAADVHALDIVPTFLGAHAIPDEHKGQKARYVEVVLQEMLPLVAESKLAEYCDVFVEEHTFDLEDARRISRKAQELGLGVRLHVDQLSPLGGAQLAAELGAASADHLEWVDGQGMAAMAEAGVAPVLCPLVPLFLGESKEAPGRAMIDAGLAPVLSTDFNPGSCYLQSLPEVASWGALRYGFQAAEGLTAITLNAAASLGRGAGMGSLEAGKQADICVTDLPSHRHLAYELGRSPVRAVIKAGRVVFQSNSRIR